MTYYGSYRTSKVCDAVLLNFLITISKQKTYEKIM